MSRGAPQRGFAYMMRISLLPPWLACLPRTAVCSTVGLRLGAAEVGGEGLEGGDVAVDVLLLVGDGEGPFLLDPGRHEDAVVHVVEPGEGGELAVHLGEVVAVLVDRLRGEDHASLCAEALCVGGEAVAVDDLLAA